MKNGRFFAVLAFVGVLLSGGGVAEGQQRNTDYGSIQFDTKDVENKLREMNGQIFHTVKWIIVAGLFCVGAYMFVEAYFSGTLRHKWLQFIGIAVFLSLLTASDKIYEAFSSMGGVTEVQKGGQKWMLD